MAISPPSDLVLDVVRAADPTDLQAAQAKLQANRAAFAATSLAEAGNGFASTVDVLNKAGTQAGLANANERSTTGKVPAAYQKFEAMVLQNFVKNILPNSDTLYGKGTAGEMWKGMMAEQLGNTMAKDGGVGIAAKMYHEQLSKTRGTGADHVETSDNDKRQALSMIDDFERKTFGTPSAENDNTGTTVTNQDSLTSQKV
ncbi:MULTISPECIES: rod-binding protein [Rhizobium]|uniref:Rod-binding protein n=2 Tax=Rhizobium TaxID=379 RepID=A0AAF1KA74_9HYPH|nr:MULTISPECIES: rod-binding protein [Rhizobium]MBO9097302.1 rod-binding protein [Rhizobium sp. L58/93]MBO9167541.1 rod-binding protein [Rhizobium sp. L245/93]MBO9183500.1 rod-binding protein [Rhizobium sp. E27B/91]MBO9133846.1 rod-binding protein [Rhizobium sp. B209b/85]MBZ5760409.1 rod-binding protein [Rhizobium sp. VS19-DR96]